MVSSLLNKLANYTNLSQGVVEHEEAEDSRRRQAKVSLTPGPRPLGPPARNQPPPWPPAQGAPSPWAPGPQAKVSPTPGPRPPDQGAPKPRAPAPRVPHLAPRPR